MNPKEQIYKTLAINAHYSAVPSSSIISSSPAVLDDQHNHWSSPSCQLDPTNTKNNLKLHSFLKDLKTLIPPPDRFNLRYKSPCWHPGKPARALMAKHGRSVRSFQCLPQVYFIGFPKSGTSQLFAMMTQHPEVKGGQHKEPHWWTRRAFPLNLTGNYPGILNYLHFFDYSTSYIAHGHPHTRLVDGSQSTAWDINFQKNFCFLPQVFAELFPGAKFIVLMREPGERLYSDFKYFYDQQWKKLGYKDGIPAPIVANLTEMFHQGVVREINEIQDCLETSSLEVCSHRVLHDRSQDICTEEPCYQRFAREYLSRQGIKRDIPHSNIRLTTSLYHMHIKRWLKEFPRDQFLFLRTDELASNPLQLANEVFRFLGVRERSKMELGRTLSSHVLRSSVGHRAPMEAKTKRILQEYFEPHNRALVKLLDDNKFEW